MVHAYTYMSKAVYDNGASKIHCTRFIATERLVISSANVK